MTNTYTDVRRFKNMEKKSNALLATMIVIALLIGGLSTYLIFPREVTVAGPEVEVIKEVPVNVTVEVIKEVLAPSVLDKAVATFMEAVDNEEDEAGNDIDLLNDYDFNEISVSKVSKDYSIVVSDDGDMTVVNFEIKLKYDELSDDEKSVREVFNVKVTYEDDEDTIVEILP
jgi:hypothetical protein